MTTTFLSNGTQFYAVHEDSVFLYTHEWELLPATSAVMLTKFAPDLEEVSEADIPEPLPPELVSPPQNDES